jgi:hypothetical protein
MNQMGFIQESVVPVRANPSHLSEMVNQLLFGDLVKILERSYSWYKIKSLEDNYIGWAKASMIREVSEAFISPDQPTYTVKETIAPLRISRNNETTTVYLCRGARIPIFPPHLEDEVVFQLGETEYRIDKQYLGLDLTAPPEAVIKTALEYLNVPYLWGGKTPFGVDCSGYLQMVFRVHGISLPRDSYQQATVGKSVDFASREPGDLAFFKSSNGKVVHVGMLTTRDRIVHAAGRVRIDFFTPEGIYSTDNKQITHVNWGIKRILG